MTEPSVVERRWSDETLDRVAADIYNAGGLPGLAGIPWDRQDDDMRHRYRRTAAAALASVDGVGLLAQPGEVDELADLRRLFQMQWDRCREADELWQAEDPARRSLTWPDLGDLLTWLMHRAAGRVARDVAEFHAHIGSPPWEGLVADMDPSTIETRNRLVVEECDELVAATVAGDRVGIADALADLVYVAYGTAYTYRIPLDRVLAEVHRSNMSKVAGPTGKAVKGPGYSPPDVAGVLADHDRGAA